MKIRVENIFYMLLYAWDALEESEDIGVATDGSTTLPDLFAAVLVNSADRLLRRGLHRGYVERCESIAGIRGKLLLCDTVKSGELWRGRTRCIVAELSHDVLHNQILKATALRLLRMPLLDDELREQLADLYRRLGEVSEIEVSDRTFRSVQLHRNMRDYRLVMNVCRFVHWGAVPAATGNEWLFRDFLREESRMRRLFERFVRGFFRREQREFRVLSNRLPWAGLACLPSDTRWVPQMRTDVRLASSTRRVIIETKFVPELLQRYHGTATFRSAHLYQLLAYLVNESLGRSGPAPEGILLYPTVSVDWDVPLRLAGQSVRVRTLDLGKPWRAVRVSLLGMLEPQSEPSVW